MDGARGVANPYLLPQVILAPVLDGIQANDSNLEPPMVRIRAPNSAQVSIDSSTDIEGSSSNFIIGGGQDPPLSMRRVKRIALNRYIGVGNSPNINGTNNTLIFRSSVTAFAVDHVATIPEGYYNTVAQGLTALVTALNAAVPASGLTFATAPYSAAAGTASDPQRARLTSSGVGPGPFTFTFAPNSSMSRFGKYLFGIPFLPYITSPTGSSIVPPNADFAAAATNNLPIGQILLLSTRWIDIVSQSLNEYTKNPSTSNSLNGSANLLARLYITQPTLNTSTTGFNSLPIATIDAPTWTNYDRSRQLGSLDIVLLDEFARVLYQAPLGILGDPDIARNWDNSYTLLELLTEI